MPYRTLLLPFFFLSGAAELIYQIIWARSLGLIFGSTTFAVTSVLASFMAGLALGACFFGRVGDRVRRPLRLLAALESGIALSALLLPHAFEGLSAFYPAVFAGVQGNLWALPAARFLLPCLALIVPCSLIGGTFPVLVRFAARAPDRFGRDVGWVYGINTLGAVAGTLLTGFPGNPTNGVNFSTGQSPSRSPLLIRPSLPSR